MIDWLVYLTTGGVLGAIVAFVIALFRTGPGKPDFPLGKVTCASIFLVLSLPYAYMWYMGKTHKASITPVVKSYFSSPRCPLEGKIEEIRIMHVAKSTAYVLLVSQEPESWGGYDHPMMRLRLSRQKKSGKWFVEKGEVLRSARLNKDEMIWPPFK
ncbi:MAG: hypothetical protein QE269_08060 [Fimbriimonas sp.]|jgi:hypothetical protein|nr:hypothetical protein [Fimbriimonas sp.]